MTDLVDLVERLRNWTRVYLCDDGRPTGSLYHDAADRIEALEAEVARLQSLAGRYIEHAADAEGLDYLDSASSWITEDEVAELEGYSIAARKALEEKTDG